MNTEYTLDKEHNLVITEDTPEKVMAKSEWEKVRSAIDAYMQHTVTHNMVDSVNMGYDIDRGYAESAVREVCERVRDYVDVDDSEVDDLWIQGLMDMDWVETHCCGSVYPIEQTRELSDEIWGPCCDDGKPDPALVGLCELAVELRLQGVDCQIAIV